MALIKSENLALGYEGHIIVENLNFEINEGDYLCIIGENGSGKSTLMKTLLGLKSKMGGSLTFGDGLKKNQIGYLPQQTLTQRDFPASAFEVVISGCLNRSGFRPFYTALQKETARYNMMLLGITELSGRCYRELSGGQQQRVLLARALCASSKLLILDEPVSGLDPKVTQEMYSIIEHLNSCGVTVVMVSHDIEAATKYASHILHISHEPLFFGTKEAYLKSEVFGAFSGKSPLKDSVSNDKKSLLNTASNEEAAALTLTPNSKNVKRDTKGEQ